MASKEHVGAQFKGVLHGVDRESGSTLSAPYEVSDKREIVTHAQNLKESYPFVRWTEASHAGSCEETGCTFMDGFGGGSGAYG